MDDDEGSGGTRIARDDTTRGTPTTQSRRTGGLRNLYEKHAAIHQRRGTNLEYFYPMLLYFACFFFEMTTFTKSKVQARSNFKEGDPEIYQAFQDRDFPNFPTPAKGR